MSCGHRWRQLVSACARACVIAHRRLQATCARQKAVYRLVRFDGGSGDRHYATYSPPITSNMKRASDVDRPNCEYQRCPTSPSGASSRSLSRRGDSLFADFLTVIRKNTLTRANARLSASSLTPHAAADSLLISALLPRSSTAFAKRCAQADEA